MKRGDMVKVEGVGSLLIHSVNGDFVRGTWQSGPLKGKQAGCGRRALLGQSSIPDVTPARTSRRARNGHLDALLEALKAGSVELASWAQERGVETLLARGLVGALRKQGHVVDSVGGGKFQLSQGFS